MAFGNQEGPSSPEECTAEIQYAQRVLIGRTNLPKRQHMVRKDGAEELKQQGCVADYTCM